MSDKRRIVLITVESDEQKNYVYPFDDAPGKENALAEAQKQARAVHADGGKVQTIDAYRVSASGKIDHEEHCPMGDLTIKELSNGN